MIQQEAIVTGVQDGRVTIQSLVQSACASCESKATCGSSLYNQFLPNREITIKSHQTLRVGDHVQVAIESQHLAFASLVVYGVPLLLMLILVGLYEGSELSAVGISVAGLALGLWLVNRFQHLVMQCITPPVILD